MSAQNFSRSGWLFMLSLLLIFLQSFLYFDFTTFSSVFNWPARLFILIDGPAHFGLLMLICWLLFFMPWQLIFRQKKFPLLLQTFGFILLNLYLLLDILVYKLYRFHINGFVWEMVTGPDAGQIFVFDNMLIAKAAGVVLVIAGVHLLAYYLSGRLAAKINCKWRYLATVFFILQLTANLSHAWAAAGDGGGIVRAALHYPLNYPLTANSFLIKHGLVDANHQKSLASDLSSGDILYPQKELVSAAGAPLYNIVFIIIDSWNYRTFDKAVCPQISALAESSMIFTNHFSGSNGTRGGIFSLFYAIPPLYWHDFEAAKIRPVFITELQERNYRINSFTSASIASPPFRQTVFGSVNDLPLYVGEGSVMERDKMISDQFTAFLDKPENLQQPFFSFLFYDLPHAISMPEDYPKKFTPAWNYADYMSLGNDEDAVPFFNLYKNCVNFDDEQIGRVINALKEKQVLDKTIIVITGDHGQEFNENHKNYWGHNGNFTRAQIGVPLIVRIPGGRPAIYNHFTTHYDIVPTVLKSALAVTNHPADYSTGFELTDSTARPWHIAGTRDNFAVMAQNQLATRNFNGTMSYTDLQLNELPRERVKNALFLEIIKEANRFYK